jgi:hypothetical protein
MRHRGAARRRRARVYGVSLAAGLLVALGASAGAGAATQSAASLFPAATTAASLFPSATTAGSLFPSATSAASLFPAATQGCSASYLDGDQRLGPTQVEAFGLVAPMLYGYNRLDGLTPAQFISTYWDPTANGGTGGWRYPPDNGFLVDASGRPIEYVSTLTVGEQIDRFGSEFGAFLAPYDTPYAERSLPPESLDDFDPSYTCNYHLYRVIKSFKADEGQIAPAFGQPGRGLQIQLNGSLLPGDPLPQVLWLVNNGYLASEN